MDESGISYDRRSPRLHVWMAATLEHGGGVIPVTLRNLSAEGALIEGDHGLAPGDFIVFRRQELAASGRIAWADGRRAGITFDTALTPEIVLRHVPTRRTRPDARYG